MSPSHLNYRANIDALKRAGCTDVISLSAVGSLRADLPPGLEGRAAPHAGKPVVLGIRPEDVHDADRPGGGASGAGSSFGTGAAAILGTRAAFF